jgi:DNA topoisomerase-1
MIYYRKTIFKSADNKTNKFKIVDKQNNVVTDAKIINYIKNLVIPPAYNDVTIYYEANPKILFDGFDDKNRKQQIYSNYWKKKANKKKFCFLLEFGKVLPTIHNDIKKYIANRNMSENKMIAIIIKIISVCYFRIGNIKYQKLYGSYGISTILKKHVKINSNNITIKFIGKKGVLNECIITDKELITQISNLLKNKKMSDKVFSYYDTNIKTDIIVKATTINNWLKTYNKTFTSKMFRTFDTNVLFIEYMRNKTDPSKLSENKRKKNVVDSMKVISCQINNTAAILKKEYMHGDIIKLYLNHPKSYKQYFHTCKTARICFINYLTDFCK